MIQRSTSKCKHLRQESGKKIIIAAADFSIRAGQRQNKDIKNGVCAHHNDRKVAEVFRDVREEEKEVFRI